MSGEYRPGGAHTRAAREESGLDSFHQLDAVRVLFFFFVTMVWRKELKSHILCHHIDNII